jgi:hypothetical protein
MSRHGVIAQSATCARGSSNDDAPVQREHLAELAAALRGGADALAVADLLEQLAGAGRRCSPFDRQRQLLRDAAARFFPDLPNIEQARQLATAWSRYAGAGWLRERQLDECPVRHRGQLAEALWELQRARPRVLGSDRIRKILAG